MKTLKFGYAVLLMLAIFALGSCGYGQKNDPVDPGAASSVRQAVPESPANASRVDTASTVRMDTATNPTMDGKP